MRLILPQRSNGPTGRQEERRHNAWGLASKTGDATVVLTALLFGALTGCTSAPKSLEGADPNLYQKVVAAEQALAQAQDALTTKVALDTTGQASASVDTSSSAGSPAPSAIGVSSSGSDWQQVLLAADDPAVAAARSALSDSTVWHDWAVLVTDGSRTVVGTAVQATLAGQKAMAYSLPWQPDDATAAPNDAASGVPSATATPSTGVTPAPTVVPANLTNLTVTVPYVQGLLDLLTAQTTMLTGQATALDTALASAQKAKAMDDYGPAVKTLKSTLSSAKSLLASTSGKVSDNATRATLQKAVAAAQKVYNKDSNIKQGDSKIAADVAAATTALTDATASLKVPSKAVTASNRSWQKTQPTCLTPQGFQKILGKWWPGNKLWDLPGEDKLICKNGWAAVLIDPTSGGRVSDQVTMNNSYVFLHWQNGRWELGSPDDACGWSASSSSPVEMKNGSPCETG